MNRYNWQTPDIIELTGTVNTPTIATVPINSMRRYFTYKLDEYLTTDGIKYINENFTSKAVPKDAKMIGEISHSLNSTIPMILKTSNNRISETVCKLAAAKSQQSTGTNEKTVKLINDFYCKNNVSTEIITIADASGVSRNNLVSVDWMTDSLNKIYSLPSFDYIKNNMARPGEGTLNNRLFELRGKAWLKTGTISGVSGITGYIMATNGDLYSVAILVQNFKVQQSQVKQLEDNILKTVSEL